MTATEQLLLQLRLANLREPVLEYRFDKKRRWRLDLAWPAADLAQLWNGDHLLAAWKPIPFAVEVHGAIHTQGRHTRGKGFEADREKMNEAQLAGWIVLEVTEEQIESGQALAWVQRALRSGLNEPNSD